MVIGPSIFEFQVWTSLIFVSTSNFVVPLLIYLKCNQFRKKYNIDRRVLTKKQQYLLKKIHFQSIAINKWVDEQKALKDALSKKRKKQAALGKYHNEPICINGVVDVIDLDGVPTRRVENNENSFLSAPMERRGSSSIKDDHFVIILGGYDDFYRDSPSDKPITDLPIGENGRRGTFIGNPLIFSSSGRSNSMSSGKSPPLSSALTDIPSGASQSWSSEHHMHLSRQTSMSLQVPASPQTPGSNDVTGGKFPQEQGNTFRTSLLNVPTDLRSTKRLFTSSDSDGGSLVSLSGRSSAVSQSSIDNLLFPPPGRKASSSNSIDQEIKELNEASLNEGIYVPGLNVSETERIVSPASSGIAVTSDQSDSNPNWLAEAETLRNSSSISNAAQSSLRMRSEGPPDSHIQAFPEASSQVTTTGGSRMYVSDTNGSAYGFGPSSSNESKEYGASPSPSSPSVETNEIGAQNTSPSSGVLQGTSLQNASSSSIAGRNSSNSARQSSASTEKKMADESAENGNTPGLLTSAQQSSGRKRSSSFGGILKSRRDRMGKDKVDKMQTIMSNENVVQMQPSSMETHLNITNSGSARIRAQSENSALQSDGNSHLPEIFVSEFQNVVPPVLLFAKPPEEERQTDAEIAIIDAQSTMQRSKTSKLASKLKRKTTIIKPEKLNDLDSSLGNFILDENVPDPDAEDEEAKEKRRRRRGRIFGAESAITSSFVPMEGATQDAPSDTTSKKANRVSKLFGVMDDEKRKKAAEDISPSRISASAEVTPDKTSPPLKRYPSKTSQTVSRTQSTKRWTMSKRMSSKKFDARPPSESDSRRRSKLVRLFSGFDEEAPPVPTLPQRRIDEPFVVPDIVVTLSEDPHLHNHDEIISENEELEDKRSSQFRKMSLPTETLYITTQTFRSLPRWVTSVVSVKTVARLCLALTWAATISNIVLSIYSRFS